MAVKRNGVQSAVRRELDAASKLDTALGRTALTLAGRLDLNEDPGSAMAAMAKELRTCLAELNVDAKVAKNPLDELRARREQKNPA